MKCPHCQVEFHAMWEEASWMNGSSSVPSPGENADIHVTGTLCPRCEKATVALARKGPGDRTDVYVAYPRNATGREAPAEVPESLRADYAEAVAILEISPQASAALSRRIVQQVLTEQGGYAEGSLARQIDAFVEDERTPSELGGNLHYLREIGNFAAHPVKSERTGEILPVEHGEAGWALEVVDGLFDYYFVAPRRNEARRREFGDRIADAGRRPLSDS